MFVIDMEKGFRTSFIINIILSILLITMAVLYFIKKPEKDITVVDLGLKSLEIEEGVIDFQPNVYNYFVTINNGDELSINAIPFDSMANINISGNSNFKLGMNRVTISVENENNQIVRYIIDVNREN